MRACQKEASALVSGGASTCRRACKRLKPACAVGCVRPLRGAAGHARPRQWGLGLGAMPASRALSPFLRPPCSAQYARHTLAYRPCCGRCPATGQAWGSSRSYAVCLACGL